MSCRAPEYGDAFGGKMVRQGKAYTLQSSVIIGIPLMATDKWSVRLDIILYYVL